MKSFRNILVVQPYGIGDALFMTPILRALHALPTVEAVDLLLGSRTEAVFHHNPHVDQIFSIDKGKWHANGRSQMLSDLTLLWEKLHGRYDLLIDFSLQREYGFYGFLLGIPRRIGLNFKNRSIFLTKSLPLRDGYEGAHAVDFYCEAARLIGLEIEDRFLEFYLSEEDREEAKKILGSKSISDSRRFVALAPGGGESWGEDAHFKRWPIHHFAELVSLLKKRMDFEGILAFGSESERQLGEALKEVSSVPVVNLCGEVSLRTCAALLERASLLIANDGGLVHLAHALGTPLVALYGPVDPAVYGPYPLSPQAVAIAKNGLPCRPCYSRFRYNSACVDRECLTELKPQTVMEELDKRDFWRVVSPLRSGEIF